MARFVVSDLSLNLTVKLLVNSGRLDFQVCQTSKRKSF